MEYDENHPFKPITRFNFVGLWFPQERSDTTPYYF